MDVVVSNSKGIGYWIYQFTASHPRSFSISFARNFTPSQLLSFSISLRSAVD